MEPSTTTTQRTTLRIGAWCVDPASGQLSRDGETTRLEARAMRLLLCLAERPGEVVSIDDLLDRVWSGVTVSQDSVYQAVTSLRRQLGDDPKQPAYIATVPRLGYRMVATVSRSAANSSEVSPAADPSAAPSSIERADFAPASDSRHPATQIGDSSGPTRHRMPRTVWVSAAALCLALAIAGLLLQRKAASGDQSSAAAITPQKSAAPVASVAPGGSVGPNASIGSIGSVGSIAVLPFLDLTEGMKEETFADGMTEELIDRLSKIPGLRVPSPTSSFYFKGKQIPVADIARTLGVAYVLDGSVRKSGGRLRVAARLVRADNGYIVWSETYDRPFNDILMIQDSIASEVTKALRASIRTTPERAKLQ